MYLDPVGKVGAHETLRPSTDCKGVCQLLQALCTFCQPEDQLQGCVHVGRTLCSAACCRRGVSGHNLHNQAVHRG